MIRFKSGDFFIVLFLIFISLILLKSFNISKGDYLIINADGENYEYSLSKNAEYKVRGPLGITTVLVHEGKVRITDSPCQNKTCVHQKDAATIICLPNKVIVRVNKREDFDGIAQ